ncbi:hypothetical protein [Paracraurococcus lichenis]|uniref:Uncharacterized protein n=1 Tax=Paracraurococcus lichenis TaxID=3064888 RepID=A0ABT9E230_9PROT|nr:hypothetical protein [Paracraurococcus sp. LOR1-02]MDO9710216.1 hypothetical protein [Paracraurococcus sp. LOR1-02]
MVSVTARDIPEKLRVTAALLGCANQKDLCAAFRRVNPNSDFDLERSYKWMQGRALPRSARVYEDWARLVGTGDRPAAWLAGCTLEEFVAALAERQARDPQALLREAGLAPAGPGAAPAAQPDSYLCGRYACYSHAQSPHYRGRLIRGTLDVAIAPRRGQGLLATYSQTLALGRVSASGTVGLFGHAMCLELRLPSPGMAPVFCTLFRPSPPASVLAGMLCGITAMDPGGQPPYATRVVMVRVAAPDPASSNRYLEAGDTPARDLAALGLPGAAGRLDDLIGRILRGPGTAQGSDQVAVADYTALAMACDRFWLGRAPEGPEAGR